VRTIFVAKSTDVQFAPDSKGSVISESRRPQGFGCTAVRRPFQTESTSNRILPRSLIGVPLNTTAALRAALEGRSKAHSATATRGTSATRSATKTRAFVVLRHVLPVHPVYRRTGFRLWETGDNLNGTRDLLQNVIQIPSSREQPSFDEIALRLRQQLRRLQPVAVRRVRVIHHASPPTLPFFARVYDGVRLGPLVKFVLNVDLEDNRVPIRRALFTE
jgi:hypothetical protein